MNGRLVNEWESDYVPGLSVYLLEDGHLLRSVLENLLNNAWKFTRNNPAAKIEFGSKNDPIAPTFYVKDNAIIQNAILDFRSAIDMDDDQSYLVMRGSLHAS